MGEFVTLTAADGFEFKAYKALPDGKPKGAIVVIQEIFGVNFHVRDLTDRVAALGYVAIAPAVFDRYERDFDVDYSAESRAKAFAFIPKLDFPAMLLDIAATKDAVAAYGKVGIVGFCLGGTMAWLGATRLGFDAAVGYYGGRIAAFAEEEPKCPVILHFGEKDEHIPLSVGESVKAHWPDVEVYNYPADHAFMRDPDPSVYDEASSVLSWERTVKLFADNIG